MASPDTPAKDLGVFLPSMSDRSTSPGDMAATARHAEALGFESVWVVDQLVAGTGVPVVDSVVALSTAAGATTRIRLGFGVVIVPLRPVVWIAKQVASLQLVSGGRVILGVGAGGDRHEGSWLAAGVPRRERGRRTDAALEVLPDLIAGKETVIDPGTRSARIQLSPAAPVPPIVVGGMSDAAIARTLAHGDGWFLLPIPPEDAAAQQARLAEAAAAARRPVPRITASMVAAIEGDDSLPARDEILRTLTDVDGVYGMPREAAEAMLVHGTPADIASRLAAYATLDVERVVVTLAAGDWYRQAELLAEARARLG